MLFPAALKRLGLAASIVLTSCLFAMMHFSFPMLLLVFTPLTVLCVLAWSSNRMPLRILGKAAFGSIFVVAVWFTYTGGSLHSFLSLNVLSIGVSLAYWRTGALWTSIAMHALFNAVSLYALNLAG